VIRKKIIITDGVGMIWTFDSMNYIYMLVYVYMLIIALCTYPEEQLVHPVDGIFLDPLQGVRGPSVLEVCQRAQRHLPAWGRAAASATATAMAAAPSRRRHR